MADAAEREALQAYIKRHDIDCLIKQLLGSLLKHTPEVTPKEHWVEMLRIEKLERICAAGGAPSREAEAGTDSSKDAARISSVPGRLCSKLFEATKRITSEIVPQDSIQMILAETSSLLNCDRVSLFVYDKRINMLVQNASNLDVPIRVKPEQGITGTVFTTRETVNIQNCYVDARFDQTFDKSTGYYTQHLLTMPIVDVEGECIGVLQAINKLSNDSSSPSDVLYFSDADEVLMENLAQHVSIALRNSEIYGVAIATSERANVLVQMLRSLSQDLGVQSNIMTITRHAQGLIAVDQCTVFLIDEGKEQLWSVKEDTGAIVRISKSKGIAGECAAEGKLIVIEDCYADTRFDQESDRQTCYTTKSMLTIPVQSQKEAMKVVAVIQMVNKKEFDGEIGTFDDEDIQIMETFAMFLGSNLERAGLADVGKRRLSVDLSRGLDLSAFVNESCPTDLSPVSPMTPQLWSANDPRQLQILKIVEGDDEEDEEGSEDNEGDMISVIVSESPTSPMGHP